MASTQQRRSRSCRSRRRGAAERRRARSARRACSTPTTPARVDGEVHWKPVKSLWISAMTLAALIGGPLYLHLGRAGAVPRHHGRHGLPRPFARHAPAADPPRLRLPAVAGAAVRLSRHAGRHGGALRHDPPARHPRLGAAQAALPSLSGAPLVDAARRLLAAALRAAARPSARSSSSSGACAEDRFYRFIERTWMAQQLPWAVLFFAIGGMPWLVWGIAVRVAASVTGHWLVGYFAHNRGPRSWHIEGAGVQGYNVPYCGLITMGEAWHNNHHAFPGSARLGLSKGETDPGWWVLSRSISGRAGLGREDTRDAAAPAQSGGAASRASALRHDHRQTVRERVARGHSRETAPDRDREKERYRRDLIFHCAKSCVTISVSACRGNLREG